MVLMRYVYSDGFHEEAMSGYVELAKYDVDGDAYASILRSIS